jgi:hypothetical protein
MTKFADKILPSKQRYLVHLLCAHDGSAPACHFTARIQLWTTRHSVHAKTHQRIFTDEYELIEIINPLLPRGSDVQNVIGHIESPDGFHYLLYLTREQAAKLGWRE